MLIFHPCPSTRLGCPRKILLGHKTTPSVIIRNIHTRLSQREGSLQEAQRLIRGAECDKMDTGTDTTHNRQRSADTKKKQSTDGYINGTKSAQDVRPIQHNGVNDKHTEATEKLATPRILGSAFSSVFNYTIAPLLLMTIIPNFALVIWYTAVNRDGSYGALVHGFLEDGLLSAFLDMWRSVQVCSTLAVGLLLGYCAWAIMLMVLVPGRKVEGPVSPKGNIPLYKDNGFACYIITMVALVALTVMLKQYGLTPTIIYDRFGDLLATVSVLSFVFCWFLYFKGRFFPSSTDCGLSGNILFDFYWGTELYPRVFGIDIKVFTNCRFGMTIWPVLVLLFAVKSYELHGFVDSMWVSAILQMAYFTKFFWWEAGYMRTIDIMVDRAGFYICWGCLVYIPSMYASVSLYLVNHPVHLGPITSLVILCSGLSAIAVNYIADWQKQHVRDHDGDCLIWGKKPEIIRAKYQTDDRQERMSILLVSGWWGVARHFHYIPELLLAFCWSVPALFTNLQPYSYVIYLTILLLHRTFRDDVKCGTKYGKYWREYCRRVPYKMIPGVF